jgi:5'-3' exonuclease
MLIVRMKMKKPINAVLDGDIIAWKAAFVVDAEGDLSIDGLVAGIVKKWTPKGVKKIKIALSSSTNFRKEVFPDYKANRKDAYKPDSLSDVFTFINNNYNILKFKDLEADDILGIYSSCGKAISVSIDKDLKGVTGWLFNPEKDKEPRYISEEEAEKWFCTQWMAGDSTDGIPGLWRIGKKTADKFLEEWDRENWYDNIVDMYADDKYAPRIETECEDLCLAMGQCVRILQKDNYDLKNNKITKMWSP